MHTARQRAASTWDDAQGGGGDGRGRRGGTETRNGRRRKRRARSLARACPLALATARRIAVPTSRFASANPVSERYGHAMGRVASGGSGDAMSSRATKCAAREEETAGFCFTDLHLRTTTGAGRSRSDAARAPSRRVARSRRAFERGFGREDAEAGGVVARYRASGCPARASTGDGAEAERRGAAAFGIRRLGSPRFYCRPYCRGGRAGARAVNPSWWLAGPGGEKSRGGRRRRVAALRRSRARWRLPRGRELVGSRIGSVFVLAPRRAIGLGRRARVARARTRSSVDVSAVAGSSVRRRFKSRARRCARRRRTADRPRDRR